MKLNKIQNMLLGIAIGDAFGAGYEFAYKNRSEYQNVDLSRYSANPNPQFRHQAGNYTDDTQMSIAIAELLADGNYSEKVGGLRLGMDLADYFLRAYKRDPKVGYAKGFQAFLDSISTKEEFLSQIKPDSIRNGAAMRSVPIGILPDLSDVVNYVIINASLTHNNPKGITSSIAIAVLSHSMIYRKNLSIDELISVEEVCNKVLDEESIDYFEQILEMKEFDPALLFGEKHKDKGVPCDAMRTVGAVTYLLSNFEQPKDILVEAVKLGGDTDSVASISLGLTMINRDISELPAHLFDNLNNDRYGRDYLIALGERLAKKFKIA